MLYAIWYHLYYLKPVKNTHEEMVLLVKLQAANHAKCLMRFLSNNMMLIYPIVRIQLQFYSFQFYVKNFTILSKINCSGHLLFY